MRWVPPPSGISYAMMVSLKPDGRRFDHDTDQHASDQPGEKQLPSLRNRSVWGGFIQALVITEPPHDTSRRAAGLLGGDGGVRHFAFLGPRSAVPRPRSARMVPAAYLKQFVKRKKNEKADAESIAEATLRPTMRFVAVKSIESQARGGFPDASMLGEAADATCQRPLGTYGRIRIGGAEGASEPEGA